MGSDVHSEAQQSMNRHSTASHLSQGHTTPTVAEAPTSRAVLDGQLDLDGSDASQDTLTSGRPPSVAPDETQEKRRDSRKIIHFSSTDPDNPYNWSKRKKLYIFFAGIITVINVSLVFRRRVGLVLTHVLLLARHELWLIKPTEHHVFIDTQRSD